MAAIPYPGGNWYQFSTTGLASGTFNDFRLRFTYNNCNKDSIKVIAGWNCSLFPASPTDYTCFKDSIFFKYESANAEVQVTPVLTPAMPVNACTPLNYEYDVLSAGQGNITNVRFYLQVPAGLTVSTPLQAEYPIGSGNWSTITSLNVGMFKIYNLSLHPNYPTATGLPGTNNSLTVNPRKFRVRFAFTTDCNFISGSNFNIAGYGRKTCGALASGSNSPFQSPPIVLNGAVVNFVMSHSLSSAPMACGATSTITAASTVVGSSSGLGSYLTYLVPVGLNYVNGSLASTSGANSPTFVSKVFNGDGTELITFNIPDNVPSGFTINYTFNLQDSIAQNCSSNPSVLTSYANAANVPCVSAVGGFCSSVAVQTGQTNHVPIVNAGNLSMVSSTFNTSPSIPNYYYVGTNLLNSGGGTYPSGGGVTISYYCQDISGNAVGAPIHAYLVDTPIASGATAASGSSFYAPPCAIPQNFMVILRSTGTCHCAVDTLRSLPVIIGPLPIDLITFQAERVNRLDAQIEWTTASESNTSHYAILRSIDGISFAEVGQKTAVGNSISNVSYTFLDKNVPQSKLYYKLMQYDLNGDSKPYGPVILKGTAEFEDITVYPNPNNGEIYFSQLLQGETVKIFDITGRMILNQKVEGNFLKLSNFETGSYYVLIMDEYNKSKMLPIVLMK
jgi:Secretion system C-terminal sorting domain